jgi:hypothetical protein
MTTYDDGVDVLWPDMAQRQDLFFFSPIYYEIAFYKDR